MIPNGPESCLMMGVGRYHIPALWLGDMMNTPIEADFAAATTGQLSTAGEYGWEVHVNAWVGAVWSRWEYVGVIGRHKQCVTTCDNV